MGYLATCPKCAFRFTGGHSHDCGSSEAVCDTCQRYFRCPTNNRWGPRVGEIITVFKVEPTGKRRKRMTKLVPTSLQFEAIEGECVTPTGLKFNVIFYPRDGLPCTECQSGTIRFGFEVGERCPWCSQAELKFTPIEH